MLTSQEWFLISTASKCFLKHSIKEKANDLATQVVSTTMVEVERPKIFDNQGWRKFLRCIVMGTGTTQTAVFQTQIISRRQKNADVKVVLSISHRQKWNSCRKFSKNCIFPNIQLKGVVDRLPRFKNLSDHTNKFLMG